MSTPTLWLRADAGVPAAGSTVTSWADPSGGGHAATAVGRPTIQTHMINGYPTVRFNRATARLATAAIQHFPTSPSGLTASTVFSTTSNSSQTFILNQDIPPACGKRFDLGYDTGLGAGAGNFGLHKSWSNAPLAPASASVLGAGTTPANQNTCQNGTALTLTNDGTGWVSFLLISGFDGPQNHDAFTRSVRKRDGNAPLSLLPYAIEHRDNGACWLHAYDMRSLGDPERVVIKLDLAE